MDGAAWVSPRALLRGRRIMATVIAVPLLVIAVLAAGLALSQASSRHGIRERFAARGKVEADVLTTYIADLMAREEMVATATLAGRHPQPAFAEEVSAFGSQAAVRYPHLAAAEAGEPTVSPIVPSAARGEAVVAFAVPYTTAYGRRVFSGAYRVSLTPLSAFLRDALTTSKARLYVVDDVGRVIASNRSDDTFGARLRYHDPALGAIPQQMTAGFVSEAGTPYYFVTRAVPHTSWTLVMAAPKSFLYVAVDGAAQWVPWAILAGLAVFLGFAAWLTTRVLAQRRRLAEANERLERLARTDSLTGLYNRRYVNEQLALHCASARRHEFSVAVLMVDVDDFKQLNDTFGHSVGDEALRHVADRLARSLRAEDLAGRWGGEEFIVVLPHTSLDEALVVAERLRTDVNGAPVALGTGDDLVTLSVSIGVAGHGGELPDTLVHRADLALYEAKRSGRNRVCAAQPTGIH